MRYGLWADALIECFENGLSPKQAQVLCKKHSLEYADFLDDCWIDESKPIDPTMLIEWLGY